MVIKGKEVIAIIPARGGSKGIPGKNIKCFSGFPLLSYSILAGVNSKWVDRIIVSTDDEKIADIACQWGAEIPFMRPKLLAQDDTTDYPVITHCINWLAENENYHPDIVVWLRPTSPIRPIDCVDNAIELLIAHPEADCVRGVVHAGQNPFKMWTINTTANRLEPLLHNVDIKESYNTPRQLLPSVYWQTGHIDTLWTKTIHNKKSMTGDEILPLMIDPRFTVDIDTSEDWAIAEQTMQNFNLDMIDPAKKRRKLPDNIKLIIFDFDGVFTDDRVWVHENGEEFIAAHRSDGLGIEILRKKTEIEMIVLSREINPVVGVRCKKLGIPVVQSVFEKDKEIRNIIAEKNINCSEVIYLGNDINDLEAFSEVGFAVAPADAHKKVLRRVDLILSKNGGKGAVRELCDMILSHLDCGS